MKFHCLLSGALLCALVSVHPAQAQTALPELPLLAPVFTDNMALQRDALDPVWGWAQPGEKVQVQVGEKKWEATADGTGRWTAEVGPFPAGGDFDLTVSAQKSTHISHVVFGDIWLCTGQSNMEFGVYKAATGPADAAVANFPQLRLFTASKNIANSPALLTSGTWAACTPDELKKQGSWGGFTAAGFYFGRALAADLKVPIGLVQTSWGGTVVQAWTSSEALRAKFPNYGPALDAVSATLTSTSPQAYDAWFAATDAGTAGKWQDPALDTATWVEGPVTGKYYHDTGVDALKDVKGVVWFRRTFDVPPAAVGQASSLQFTAYEVDTVWINGTQVGQDLGPSGLRNYSVPSDLLKPTGNTIAIRVLNRGNLGGLPGPLYLVRDSATGKTAISLGATWLYKVGVQLPTTPAPPPNIYSNPNAFSVLFNGMINPLLPMRIKGVIWYQGESNAGEALRYRDLLSTMITDWRTRFNEPDFPFLIVQLAGWGPGHTFPDLRQAQWETAQTVPNTGIATAMDLGNEGDIHPTDKKDVGERLALVARRMVYGEKIEDSGPTYQSLAVEGSAVRVSFAHLGGGLVSKSGAELTGFELAGADGKYQAAQAHIDGDSVVVSAATVPTPVSVRYAWAPFPAASLNNVAGLPAFPFDSALK